MRAPDWVSFFIVAGWCKGNMRGPYPRESAKVLWVRIPLLQSREEKEYENDNSAN